MKFEQGQIVVALSYNEYQYEILAVLNPGYRVKNLTLRNGRVFNIHHPNLIENFEEDCITLELYKSPLFEALK